VVSGALFLWVPGEEIGRDTSGDRTLEQKISLAAHDLRAAYPYPSFSLSSYTGFRVVERPFRCLSSWAAATGPIQCGRKVAGDETGGATGCGKDAGWKSPTTDSSIPLGNPAQYAGFPLSHNPATAS
jgi:hypothetical protein